MKIIGSARDYFDTFVYQYGADDKIVHNRLPLTSQEVFHANDGRHVFYPTIPVDFGANIEDICYEAVLLVCGRVYPLVYVNDEMEVCNKGDTLVIFDPNKHKAKRRQWFFRSEKSYKVGEEVPSAINVLKALGKPIVKLNSTYRGFEADAVYPVLGDYGLAKFCDAEQLYQDVCYWIANVLNESPDVQPAGKPPQTSEEKIVSHGFDPKKSFRHRV